MLSWITSSAAEAWQYCHIYFQKACRFPIKVGIVHFSGKLENAAPIKDNSTTLNHIQYVIAIYHVRWISNKAWAPSVLI